MLTRNVLEQLGFTPTERLITEKQPSYFFDFGNLKLEAAQVTNFKFKSVFTLSGVQRSEDSMRVVDFEIPLELESYEHGVAWLWWGLNGGSLAIAHRTFDPDIEPTWYSDGERWQDRLPWIKRMIEHKARPQCVVERDWLKVVSKKLRTLAVDAHEARLVSCCFDGTFLEIVVDGKVWKIQGWGKPWPGNVYVLHNDMVWATKRFMKPMVSLSVWEEKLTIGNRVVGVIPHELIARDVLTTVDLQWGGRS